MLFQRAASKELISVTSLLALLGKNLSSVVSENWFLVGKKLANFFVVLIHVSGNVVAQIYPWFKFYLPIVIGYGNL